MGHKFSVGQSVVFSAGPQDIAASSGSCTITRLLPKEGAEYQYHIRSAADGHERHAMESQLHPLGKDQPKPGPEDKAAQKAARLKLKLRGAQHLR